MTPEMEARLVSSLGIRRQITARKMKFLLQLKLKIPLEASQVSSLVDNCKEHY